EQQLCHPDLTPRRGFGHCHAAVLLAPNVEYGGHCAAPGLSPWRCLRPTVAPRRRQTTQRLARRAPSLPPLSQRSRSQPQRLDNRCSTGGETASTNAPCRSTAGPFPQDSVRESMSTSSIRGRAQKGFELRACPSTRGISSATLGAHNMGRQIATVTARTWPASWPARKRASRPAPRSTPCESPTAKGEVDPRR